MKRIRGIAAVFVMLMVTIAGVPATAFSSPVVPAMPLMPMHGAAGEAGNQMPCCSCTMMVQEAGSSRETSSRAAAVPSGASSSGTNPLPVTILPGRVGRVSGIRRIYAANVLDLPERAAVYHLIVSQPGIGTAELGRRLGIHRETLRYHLDLLAGFRKIVVTRDYGTVRFYENHGRYGDTEQRMLRHLRNPTAAGILSLIQAGPGIAQSEIAVRLGITSPTVRWYVQRFEEDGLISVHRDGRFARYILTDTSASVLNQAAISSAVPLPG